MRIHGAHELFTSTSTVKSSLSFAIITVTLNFQLVCLKVAYVAVFRFAPFSVSRRPVSKHPTSGPGPRACTAQ